MYEVVVGVLSARHHYDLRKAIRDTWLGYLRDQPDFQNRYVYVRLLFLHGNVVNKLEFVQKFAALIRQTSSHSYWLHANKEYLKQKFIYR